MTGDEVTVFGSVKAGTLNLEKIKVNRLNMSQLRNPVLLRETNEINGKRTGLPVRESAVQ